MGVRCLTHPSFPYLSLKAVTVWRQICGEAELCSGMEAFGHFPVGKTLEGEGLHSLVVWTPWSLRPVETRSKRVHLTRGIFGIFF